MGRAEGDADLRVHTPLCLQVEMVYQDALYTVLHRAGTMDPHHVDDQEALLLYLQQVSSPPTPPCGPC